MDDIPHLLSNETTKTPPLLSRVDDIVERLRDFAEIVEGSKGVAVVAMLSADVFVEAADEIERLSESLHNALRLLAANKEKHHAQIEALRNELEDWKRTVRAHEDVGTSTEAATEIADLRKEVQRLHLRLMVAYSEMSGLYDQS